jgi:ubiquinone/menaquinone biosynthesis C-methylase UbiE
MPASFATAAIAEGYARARPPLHARIVERFGLRAKSALDVGCGAGLSTAPLLRLAGRVTGIDPAREMLRWANRTAPGAQFLAARVEALPFRDGVFDLIAAAGSLNYAEPVAAFRELRRVIAPASTLCVYDFSQVDFPFERPPDGAIPLSPEILSQMATEFQVVRSEPFEMSVTMTRDQFLAYLRTETEIVPEVDATTTELVFRGYIAWLRPLASD